MFKDFINAISTGDIVTALGTVVGQAATFLIAALLLLFILVLNGKNKTQKVKIKELTYTSIAIAIATVLSMIKVLQLPQGGAITLCSMLFIVLVGYWYGIKQGMLAGFVFGLLQIALGGYIVHPVQILLDYPLAFAALGLSGLFSKTEGGLIKGLMVGAFGRFVCHFISGIIFFASYAPKDWDPMIYSAAYNISYIGVEVFLTAIIISIPALDIAMKTIKRSALNES